MLDAFAVAAAAIRTAFVDPEPLIYTCAGEQPVGIAGVWFERDLPAGGREVVYEIAYDVLLPKPPSKRDSFIHRGHTWRPLDHPRSYDAIGAWQMPVASE